MTHCLDILIKNALIYDGSGSEPFYGSVGIIDGKIVSVGNEQFDSNAVIDAYGLCLSPGFVDTHGHSDFTLLKSPTAESKLLQGVTTEINGNCGVSAAPLLKDAKVQRNDDLQNLDIQERWSLLDEYLRILGKKRPWINFVTLTGHGNIRASVIGYANVRAGNEDTEKMVALLKQSIDAGSHGLSTGLIYPPGVFTETQEIISLLRPFRNYNVFIYTTHMRSEGDKLIESIEETISIGKETGIKVHISHLKTSGQENWHKIDQVLERIDCAKQNSLDITFDRYPYTAASTDLDTMLPVWAFEGGNALEMKRLRDRNIRKELVRYLKSKHNDRAHYASVIVSSVNSGKNRWTEGKSILTVSEQLNKEPEEAILDLLVEEQLHVGAIFESMSEDNLRKILKHPLCMVGSDSSARSYEGVTARGRPHPRGFGTFPRFLGKYVIEDGLMSLQEGIRRVTSFPAETFGLKGRGYIRKGYFADIVLFDCETLKDKATYENPFIRPEGIEYVIVNGKVVVSKSKLSKH